jgi:hypothetical protein
VHGVDHDLDGFLGQLLTHLAAAREQQPRRLRRRGVGALGGEHRTMKPVKRIGHGATITPSRRKSINVLGPSL